MAATHTDEPRWLNDEEMELWRLILRGDWRIDRSIDEALQQGEGITVAEFSVLVVLTESEEPAVRLKEICRKLEWDRSRTSHQITRMERRGLIVKEKSECDARGVEVRVTEEGRRRIEAAAPGHVEVVRQLIFDHITEEEKAALKSFYTKVLAVKVDNVKDFQSGC